MDLIIEVAECYYRLALSKAVRRDLSGAVRFARNTCLLNENHEKAARLLELCLYELGEENTVLNDVNKLKSARMKQTIFGKVADIQKKGIEQTNTEQKYPGISVDARREVIEQTRMKQVALGKAADTKRGNNEQTRTKQTPLEKPIDISKEIIERISVLAQQRKWRKALRLVSSIPHQSVRVLNIQGCLYACAQRYKRAARLFSDALEKDHANLLAAKGLIESTQRQKLF